MNMVWNAHLESGPLGCKLLIVKHGLQDLLVTPGDQAHGTQNFKNCDLCTNVFRGQTLSNNVDTVWMSKHMSSTLLLKYKENKLCECLHVQTWNTYDNMEIVIN